MTSVSSIEREVDRARVVDADVDAAEALGRLRDGVRDGVGVAHVADDRQRLPAGRLDLLGGGVDRAGQLRVGLGGLGQQRHVGAVAGRAQRDREADAAAAAGHEQGPVFQAHPSPLPAIARTVSTVSASAAGLSSR